MGTTRSHFGGFSGCGAQTPGAPASVVAAQGPINCDLRAIECVGSSSRGRALAALQHVESPWARDRTCVLCIGRWIPIHYTTREVLPHHFSPLSWSMSFLLLLMAQKATNCHKFSSLKQYKFIISQFCRSEVGLVQLVFLVVGRDLGLMFVGLRPLFPRWLTTKGCC